jgi:hypothetical protein
LPSHHFLLFFFLVKIDKSDRIQDVVGPVGESGDVGKRCNFETTRNVIKRYGVVKQALTMKKGDV